MTGHWNWQRFDLWPENCLTAFRVGDSTFNFNFNHFCPLHFVSSSVPWLFHDFSMTFPLNFQPPNNDHVSFGPLTIFEVQDVQNLDSQNYCFFNVSWSKFLVLQRLAAAVSFCGATSDTWEPLTTLCRFLLIKVRVSSDQGEKDQSLRLEEFLFLWQKQKNSLGVEQKPKLRMFFFFFGESFSMSNKSLRNTFNHRDVMIKSITKNQRV